MEQKILKLMIRVARISQQFAVLSKELDDIYELLADEDFLKAVKLSETPIKKEDYD